MAQLHVRNKDGTFKPSKSDLKRIQKLITVNKIEKEMKSHLRDIKRLRPDYKKALKKLEQKERAIGIHQMYLSKLTKKRDEILNQIKLSKEQKE